MVTKRAGATSQRKGNVPNGDYPIPPLFVAPPRRLKQDWKSVMGWLAACVLVVLLLPLVGMMMLDNLTIATRAEKALEKIEKIEKRIERDQREKNRKQPNSFTDNPVLGGVRRPLQIPMPRSKKLGNS